MTNIILESYNLETAERLLCNLALDAAGNIVEAAKLLGLTRCEKRSIVNARIGPT